MVENLAMLFPLFHAFLATKERHEFLEKTIGAIPQEKECFEKLYNLTITMASLVGSAAPIQMILISIYNRMGHPWSNFFKQF